ncbi:unnamed protein product [Schistocephalus solidus]|uniref:Reverse transcriptase domain-containing protein n=1 Tax=Schistocephalus solidus TaxID=70667 RepID=A0A183TEW8_SCHSO|nr:unnamed protein product [Schistocephalus solidus]
MSLINNFLDLLDWQNLSSINDAASISDFMSVVSNNILEFVPTKIVKPYTSEYTSVVVIFFDLSKAFDKVPHRPLLVKQEALGIRSPLLDFIGSHLSNRSQKVFVVSTMSSTSLTSTGGYNQYL